MKFNTAMFHFIRNQNKNYKVNFFPEKKFSFYMQNKIYNRIAHPLEIIKENKLNDKFILTFDGGYREHYNISKIYLKKQKGIFFINGKVIEKKDFLDVNKIQLIVNNYPKNDLLYLIEDLLSKRLKKKFLISKLPKESQKYRPLDTKNISTFKYIFQIYLPIKISTKILNIVFYDHLKIDHKKVFKDLYLNLDQILEMRKNGMIFGNHSYNHFPLIKLNYKEQLYEIRKNHDFLKKYDLLDHNFFAYPYGLYNKITLKILKKLNYNFAFTVKKSKSNLNKPLEISRKDAIYL